MPRELGELRRLELREVWTSEPAEFTPWLADTRNRARLADALGLPELELIQTEHAVGPFRADIVCRVPGTEQLVLIENQIERSDHTHLGQVLTYAAGLEAAVVIWIAARFTDEHRAVLDLLNRITPAEITCFGVEVEVLQIHDSRPAPRFNIVSQPNDWVRAVRTTGRRAEPEGIDVSRVAYWSAFNDILRSRRLPLHIREEPPRQGYYSFTLDRPRQVYLYAFRDVSRKRIGVYIGIYGNASAIFFAELHQQRQAIEAEIGGTLHWREDGKRKTILKEEFGMDPTNETEWPQQHRWLGDWLERYLRAFQPRIARLPAPADVTSEIDVISEP